MSGLPVLAVVEPACGETGGNHSDDAHRGVHVSEGQPGGHEQGQEQQAGTPLPLAVELQATSDLAGNVVIGHETPPSVDEVSIARKPVCLNIGCGPLQIDGEIGVDKYPTEAAEVIADVTDHLPWDDGIVDRVRLDHVLEHLEGRFAVTALLECWRVLRPGGLIRVGVPDLAATCREYAGAATLADRAILLRWLYGSQAHDGEYHKSGWDAETLTDLLTAVGFVDVTVRDDTARTEGICIVAEARKP